MADLRIVDAPVLLQESITDDVKMPTGGLGNFSVRLGDILWYVITKEQLANKSYVDLSSKGVKDSLDVHIADKANPHNITKAQVGLGNVDNTADVDKPVSNAVSSAIITATNDMATKAYVNSRDGDLSTLTTTDKTSLVKAINEIVSVKADKATKLAGYGISDAYTKSEIDTNYGGVKTLYDKNVEAGAGANGWTDILIETEKGGNQQNVNHLLTNGSIPFEFYEHKAVNGDWSPAIQAMFDYAASVYPKLVRFYGKTGRTYEIKSKNWLVNDSEGWSIFKQPGNACVVGNGYTLKLADNFGDFNTMFQQDTRYPSVKGWEISGFTIDQNTRNNPKTLNNSPKNSRTIIFQWCVGNQDITITNLTVDDFIGTWFVSQGITQRAVITHNKVTYNQSETPHEDRTVVYCHANNAWIVKNEFIGGHNTEGGIELHGSNQTVAFNRLVGFGAAFHLVSDSWGGAGYIPETENQKVIFNDVINCNVLAEIWCGAAATPRYKNTLICCNTAILDSYRGTDKFYSSCAVFFSNGSWNSIELRDVEFSNNTINYVMRPENKTTVNQINIPPSHFSLSGTWGGDKNPLVKIDGFRIINNVIRGGVAGLFGMDFGQDKDSNSSLKHFQFSGNKFYEQGYFAGNAKYDLFSISGMNYYDDFVIEDNEISFLGTADISKVGVVFALSNPYSNTDNASNAIKYINNKVNHASASPIPLLYGRQIFVDTQHDYKRLKIDVNAKIGSIIKSRGATYQKLGDNPTDWMGEIASYTIPAGFYKTRTFIKNADNTNDYYGQVCMSDGYIADYVWSAGKAVNKGDIIEIDGRFYLATNGGTLGTVQPTALESDFTDNEVSLKYLSKSKAYFDKVSPKLDKINSATAETLLTQFNALLQAMKDNGGMKKY